MRYAFPCDIVQDEEEKELTGREAYNVSFPDVPEAITCGWSWKEAVDMAEDALSVALSFYVDGHQEIPHPRPVAKGQVLIAVPPIAASKLVIYTAMHKQGITNADLGGRLQLSEDAVRKLLDTRYRTHMSQIERALKAVGRSLIIEDQDPPQEFHHASTPEIPAIDSPRSS